MLAIAVAVVLVPLLVLLGRAIFGSWTTVADYAALELRTRAVGGTDTPLVGPYSRYGWNHPGPLVFYALFLPYRALGSEGTGLLAGALLLNASAIACSLWVFWRRGSTAGLALGALAIAALVHGLGAGFLDDPWNPYIVVLPGFAMMLLTWSVAAGDHWMLPLVALTASFTTQTHVSMLAPSLACAAYASGFVIADARRDKVADLRRIVLGAALVLVVVWIPPLVEQFRGGGGNLGALWDFWRAPTEPGVSAARAARIVGAQLGFAPPWITGHEHLNFAFGALDPPWTLPIVLALLVGAVFVAARRHDRSTLSLGVLALVLVAVSWVATTRVVGEPLPYLVRWTWAVGALCWVAIGWTALREVQARAWNGRVILGAAAVAVTAALIAATTVSATSADRPVALASEVVDQLTPAVVDAVRNAPGPVLVRAADTFSSAGTAVGVAAALVRAGIPAGIESEREWVVGPQYAVDAAEAGTVLVVIGDELDPAVYGADSQLHPIAQFDTLDAPDRATFTDFEAELARAEADLSDEALGGWLHDHATEIRVADTLKRRAARGTVYLVGANA